MSEKLKRIYWYEIPTDKVLEEDDGQLLLWLEVERVEEEAPELKDTAFSVEILVREGH